MPLDRLTSPLDRYRPLAPSHVENQQTGTNLLVHGEVIAYIMVALLVLLLPCDCKYLISFLIRASIGPFDMTNFMRHSSSVFCRIQGVHHGRLS